MNVIHLSLLHNFHLSLSNHVHKINVRVPHHSRNFVSLFPLSCISKRLGVALSSWNIQGAFANNRPMFICKISYTVAWVYININRHQCSMIICDAQLKPETGSNLWAGITVHSKTPRAPRFFVSSPSIHFPAVPNTTFVSLEMSPSSNINYLQSYENRPFAWPCTFFFEITIFVFTSFVFMEF